MITALSVNVPEKPTGIKKLINMLRCDRIDVEIKRARGVSLKHITYTSYSGKIHLEKADKIIGAQRNHLLCPEKLRFPPDSGYKRFYSTMFSARLCVNMALCVLMECVCPEKLKIGIYDQKAVIPEFLLTVLEYCSDVAVVTQNCEPYYCVTSRAMDELGASAVVTKNISELVDCTFIIAPDVIEEKLPLRSDAVVLTVACPKVPTSGLVYYKYHFRMPNGFDEIKPDDMDEEYFCSALYTLGSQYELGSIVPMVCRNFSSSQTVKSLCAYVNRFA